MFVCIVEYVCLQYEHWVLQTGLGGAELDGVDRHVVSLFVRFCWRGVISRILTHPLQQDDPVMLEKNKKKNKQHVDTFWCPWIHHLLNSDKHTHDMCQSWLRGLLFCFAQRDVSYGSHSKPQVFYATCGWGPGPPSFTLSLLWAHCSMLGKANKRKINAIFFLYSSWSHWFYNICQPGKKK